MWDPRCYLEHAAARARPFHELMARVDAHLADPEAVRAVADLGCGTGALTARLAARWPTAQVIGVDSSAEMLAAADPSVRSAGVRLVQADLVTWVPDRPPDVLVSHATLQWVPGHLDLLPRLAGFLAPAGVLALQVPGSFDQPLHVRLRELCDSPAWSARLGAGRIARPAAYGPGAYLDALAACGLTVDAWESTYLHVLPGADAVLSWVRGTALRPVLATLDEALAERFVSAYAELLQADYPPGPYGTVLPFRRVFAVARAD